jgi:hypothetical protein
VVSWIVQLTIIGLMFYWIAGEIANNPVNSQPPVDAAARAPAQVHADSFAKNLEAARKEDARAQVMTSAHQDPVYLSSGVLNDLVKLSQAHVSENNILAYVRQHPASNRVSADELLYLASNGVPKSVIVEYLRCATEQTQKPR